MHTFVFLWKKFHGCNQTWPLNKCWERGRGAASTVSLQWAKMQRVDLIIITCLKPMPLLPAPKIDSCCWLVQASMQEDKAYTIQELCWLLLGGKAQLHKDVLPPLTSTWTSTRSTARTKNSYSSRSTPPNCWEMVGRMFFLLSPNPTRNLCCLVWSWTSWW